MAGSCLEQKTWLGRNLAVKEDLDVPEEGESEGIYIYIYIYFPLLLKIGLFILSISLPSN